MPIGRNVNFFFCSHYSAYVFKCYFDNLFFPFNLNIFICEKEYSYMYVLPNIICIQIQVIKLGTSVRRHKFPILLKLQTSFCRKQSIVLNTTELHLKFKTLMSCLPKDLQKNLMWIWKF